MGTTYKAILTGDRVQWLGDAPETNGGIAVEITVPQPARQLTAEERGRAMRVALDALVASNAAAAFGDPLEWQREVRKDRPLPGRED